jgi:exodeoxyribonuclease V alpha subunit
MKTNERELSGEIIQIRVDRGNWFAGVLYDGQCNHAISGRCSMVPGVGSVVKVTGVFADKPPYGQQFTFNTIQVAPPSNRKGLIAFLRTLENVGDIRARRIVDEIGLDCLDKIIANPSVLHGKAGLGPAYAKPIADQILAKRNLLASEVALCEMGFSAKMRQRIAASGMDMKEVLETNPYLLLNIEGVEFLRIDGWVLRKGLFAADSPDRGAAVIHAAIKRACAEDGHTWQDEGTLAHAVSKLKLAVPYPVKAIPTGIEKAVQVGLVSRTEDGVALPALQRAENDAASIISAWLAADYELGSIDLLDPVMRDMLTEKQYMGVENATKHRVSILTGGPGTGKTHTSQAILKSMPSTKVQIVAPTGKAAKRANEVTGYEASTIHRFIGRMNSLINNPNDPKSPEDVIPQVTLCDEASMVDAILFANLLRTLAQRHDARIVIVGDVNQLPSVSAGRVLADLIESGAIPTVHLTKVMRQAEESKIISNAYRINSGMAPDNALTEKRDWCFAAAPEVKQVLDYLGQFMTVRAARMGFDPIKDVQVLTGQKTTELGTKTLNESVRAALNPPAPEKAELTRTSKSGGKEVTEVLFRVGDKVMFTNNDYELGVVNGDQGIVVGIELGKCWAEHKITVKVDGIDTPVVVQNGSLDDLTQAWAITVHKCVAPNTIVRTEHGYQRIEDIAKTGFIAGPNGRLTPYVDKFEQPERDMLCLRTGDGYDVTITPEHGMDVWRNGDWCRVNGSDVIIGDILRMRLGEEDSITNEPTLPAAPAIDIRAKTHAIPERMTCELAEFMGMMVADGTIFKGFRVAKRHIDDIDRFSKLCKTLFGIDVKRWSDTSAHYAEVYSTQIASWLSVIGGMSPNAKRVPSIIMQSTPSSRRSFLRGVFLDGSVNVKHGVLDHIELTTKFDELNMELRQLLLAEGIACGTTTDKHKLHRIEIYGPFAKLFAEKIGFECRMKQNLAETPVGLRTRYMIPINFKSMKHVQWPTASSRKNASNRTKISRTLAWKLGLNDLLQYHYVKIDKIEHVRERSFCVTVPDGHRFLQNGFVGWNSQGSEYPVAVVICHDTMGWALQRALLYTAVTRGKKHVILFSTEGALATAVKGETPLRMTRLCALLIKAVAAVAK